MAGAGDATAAPVQSARITALAIVPDALAPPPEIYVPRAPGLRLTHRWEAGARRGVRTGLGARQRTCLRQPAGPSRRSRSGATAGRDPTSVGGSTSGEPHAAKCAAIDRSARLAIAMVIRHRRHDAVAARTPELPESTLGLQSLSPQSEAARERRRGRLV